VGDAQVNVDPLGLVAQAHQHVPQTQAVLAARHGHQHLVSRPEHPIPLDGALGVLAQPGRETVCAQGQLVLAHLDDGVVATAALAFHSFPRRMVTQGVVAVKRRRA